MAPNYQKCDTSTKLEDSYENLVPTQAAPRKYQIVYRNVIICACAHIAALYGLYLLFTSAKWSTILFTIFTSYISAFGITAGAHRLWTHKTYKAKLPLEILLMLLNCLAFQGSVIYWVREHRMHHKYSDTDADPHNSTRGFFFSHIGWLLVKRHPELLKRGNLIDVSDVNNNPVLKFQKKYQVLLFLSICFVLPTLTPVYYWGESLNNALFIGVFRYIYGLHATFLVNSAAHKWGNKPYDNKIRPVENKTVSFLSVGEGFHNYHHVFPRDYRTAELGNNNLNWTTKFIDFFAWIGWAYDLKTVSPELLDMRLKRTGEEKNTMVYKNLSDELIF